MFERVLAQQMTLPTAAPSRCPHIGCGKGGAEVKLEVKWKKAAFSRKDFELK